jgi:hypothetical protein
MDVKKLIRDPKRVQAYLEELPDGSLVCKKAVKIYIPARFAERGLAQIGIETYIVGIYAIVVEDVYYGVSLVNAMMPIEPTSTLKIQIDGDDYYEFTFDAGSVVCPSTDLVKTDVLVYKIYDEIISKGRVPWYLGYLELGQIFDTAGYHAGANIGKNQEVTELIISMISRSEKDRNKYYRTTIQSLDELMTNRPAFIPLRSVQYAATNTTNKLAGSYFSDALVSALVNPSDRVERIESLLRA